MSTAIMEKRIKVNPVMMEMSSYCRVSIVFKLICRLYKYELRRCYLVFRTMLRTYKFLLFTNIMIFPQNFIKMEDQNEALDVYNE